MTGQRRIRTRLVLIALCSLAIGVQVCVARDAPEAIFRRADGLDREGKSAKAAEEYRLFLKEYPKHSQAAQAHYRLATCLDAIGHVDDAVKHLETAVSRKYRQFRKRQDALYLLGKLLGDLKEHRRATEVFERLLAGGAGLYEEEVLNLCGGYYAVLEQYDDAAAKFNILKRRKTSRYAERAAYKLALLWLEAGNTELAVDAVSDLATQYPQNQEARALMLQLSGIFRQQRRFDQAIAICEQLKTRFPRAREALACGYIIGLCHRDRKQYGDAVAALEAAARLPENVQSGLAAEAMLKAADIYFIDLQQTDKAMAGYEESAGYAREHTDAARRAAILEQCYFRLAEHYFAGEKWSVALEFYSLLREVGTKINILPRIMKCQTELNIDLNAFVRRDEEVAFIKKRIAELAGTFAAAEGEVFLADRELARIGDAVKAEAPYRQVADTYLDILARYPKDILSQYHLESYARVQLGHCLAGIYRVRRQADPNAEGWNETIAAFENALLVDEQSPYRQEVLEWVARTADAAGQKKKAFDAYQQLYALAGDKLQQDQDDAKAREDMTGYLRSMLARAGEEDSIDTGIQLCDQIIAQEGAASPSARYALFYMAELYYLHKDFAAAAKTYQRFIRTYGPPQTPEGDLAKGPWQVGQPDETVLQVYEAAVRVAHAWYLQGHTQNMLKAYRWLVKNVPHQNRYVAEARYWLTMELAKGADANTKEKRRELAVAMWTKVVAPWYLDSPPSGGTGDPQRGRPQPSDYYFWVHDREMSKYVKPAIIKCGELLSGLEDHRLAAFAFRTYLEFYPPPRPARDGPPPRPDEMHRIARYMLGREYVALREIEAMTKVYEPYLSGERDDPFRLAGLRLMGFAASVGDLLPRGVEAYATILDEYGQNRVDGNGDPVPVPATERIRQGNFGWDGIRMYPPEGLDLGEVRYALGFLYWKNKDWATCIRALTAFVGDPALKANRSRAKSIYMVARSYYKSYDYANGVKVLLTLVQECPEFEAVEEAYGEAARGAVKVQQWKTVDFLHSRFVQAHPRSQHRPHLDLYSAIAMINTDRRNEGATRLLGLIKSDAYEDVKADACYHLGRLEITGQQPAGAGAGEYKPIFTKRDYRSALRYFHRSIELYPRERALVAAARTHMVLEEWEPARALLNRTLSDFSDGDRNVLEEAKRLLPTVLKAIADKQAET